MAGEGRPTKFTAQKKGKFLAKLREHGNIRAACRSVGLSHMAAYKNRKEDPEFLHAWDDALKEYTTVLEAEADRRGVEGCSEPVYYQGEVVGHIQKYSDVLLMFRLKKLDPRGYRDRVEYSGDEENPLVFKDATSRQQRITALLTKRSGDDVSGNGHEVEAGVDRG
jgi:hypothetical protein